jgi:hypothetical protein
MAYRERLYYVKAPARLLLGVQDAHDGLFRARVPDAQTQLAALVVEVQGGGDAGRGVDGVREQL